MKIHRGAVLYDSLGYIDGNVLGAGMSADEIVSAISSHGLLFSSSAPVAIPQEISYPTYDALADTRPEESLGDALVWSSVPGDHIPQSPPAAVSAFYALHMILWHADVVVPHPTPNDDPPVLVIGVSATGCNKVSVFDTESLPITMSQALTGSDGSQDPHSHYGFAVVAESDACGVSDDFGISVIPVGIWNKASDYVCQLIPSGIVIRKEF